MSVAICPKTNCHQPTLATLAVKSNSAAGSTPGSSIPLSFNFETLLLRRTKAMVSQKQTKRAIGGSTLNF